MLGYQCHTALPRIPINRQIFSIRLPDTMSTLTHPVRPHPLRQLAKWLLAVGTIIALLGGCSATWWANMHAERNGYAWLNDLKGRHISEVAKRVPIVERNGTAYYLYRYRQYSHTVHTYNGLGQRIGSQDVYHEGWISLITSYRGIIKYAKVSYQNRPDPDSAFGRQLHHALRDLLPAPQPSAPAGQ